jgi:hypothetical protein
MFDPHPYAPHPSSLHWQVVVVVVGAMVVVVDVYVLVVVVVEVVGRLLTTVSISAVLPLCDGG